MRVVVIGGGLGGLATAARLAKLGHGVTLLEQGDRLGGALRPWEEAGFTWDRGAHSTLLPAVLRDLFRKSGRPLERELDLVPLDVIRRHRFADGSVLALPGGRAAQLRAVDELGPGLGQRWLDHVASYADTWESLRRHHLEVATPLDRLPDPARAVLDGRESLHRRLRRDLRDERLRLVAGHRFVAEGHDPRNVPSWMGVHGYLEQRFGAWTVPGGLAAVTDALARRMETRGVDVRTGTTARDVVVRGGRCVAVATDAGELDAEAVVCAVDPRRLPTLAPHVEATMPALPPVLVHLGLAGVPGDGVPDVGHELVLHGDPLLVVRTGGTAPEGHTAWTVHGRGRIAEDLLAGPGPGRGRRPRPGGRTGRPLGPGPGRGGRVGDGRAVAGPRHGTPPAGPDHAGARGVRRRSARAARRRGPDGGAVGRAGGRGGRPGRGPLRQAVIRSAAKISRVARDRLSV